MDGQKSGNSIVAIISLVTLSEFLMKMKSFKSAEIELTNTPPPIWKIPGDNTIDAFSELNKCVDRVTHEKH